LRFWQLDGVLIEKILAIYVWLSVPNHAVYQQMDEESKPFNND